MPAQLLLRVQGQAIVVQPLFVQEGEYPLLNHMKSANGFVEWNRLTETELANGLVSSRELFLALLGQPVSQLVQNLRRSSLQLVMCQLGEMGQLRVVSNAGDDPVADLVSMSFNQTDQFS